MSFEMLSACWGALMFVCPTHCSGNRSCGNSVHCTGFLPRGRRSFRRPRILLLRPSLASCRLWVRSSLTECKANALNLRSLRSEPFPIPSKRNTVVCRPRPVPGCLVICSFIHPFIRQVVTMSKLRHSEGSEQIALPLWLSIVFW